MCQARILAVHTVPADAGAIKDTIQYLACLHRNRPFKGSVPLEQVQLRAEMFQLPHRQRQLEEKQTYL